MYKCQNVSVLCWDAYLLLSRENYKFLRSISVFIIYILYHITDSSYPKKFRLAVHKFWRIVVSIQLWIITIKCGYVTFLYSDSYLLYNIWYCLLLAAIFPLRNEVLQTLRLISFILYLMIQVKVLEISFYVLLCWVNSGA